jgi:hypothetical protein
LYQDKEKTEMLKLAQEEKNYKKMVQNDLKAEDE